MQSLLLLKSRWCYFHFPISSFLRAKSVLFPNKCYYVVKEKRTPQPNLQFPHYFLIVHVTHLLWQLSYLTHTHTYIPSRRTYVFCRKFWTKNSFSFFGKKRSIKFLYIYIKKSTDFVLFFLKALVSHAYSYIQIYSVTLQMKKKLIKKVRNQPWLSFIYHHIYVRYKYILS